jgi:putative FmdB family regulatory protein
MPLYDYACHNCKQIVEVFHRMDDYCVPKCLECNNDMEKLISAVFTKRPDATWVQDLNGFVNDLEMVNQGRMKKVETREDAKDYINHLYKDPHPEPKHKHEEAANKRVGELRKRYLDRF